MYLPHTGNQPQRDGRQPTGAGPESPQEADAHLGRDRELATGQRVHLVRVPKVRLRGAGLFRAARRASVIAPGAKKNAGGDVRAVLASRRVGCRASGGGATPALLRGSWWRARMFPPCVWCPSQPSGLVSVPNRSNILPTAPLPLPCSAPPSRRRCSAQRHVCCRNRLHTCACSALYALWPCLATDLHPRQ